MILKIILIHFEILNVSYWASQFNFLGPRAHFSRWIRSWRRILSKQGAADAFAIGKSVPSLSPPSKSASLCHCSLLLWIRGRSGKPDAQTFSEQQAVLQARQVEGIHLYHSTAGVDLGDQLQARLAEAAASIPRCSHFQNDIGLGQNNAH